MTRLFLVVFSFSVFLIATKTVWRTNLSLFWSQYYTPMWAFTCQNMSRKKVHSNTRPGRNGEVFLLKKIRCSILMRHHFSVNKSGIHKWNVRLCTALDCTIHHLACTTQVFTFAPVGGGISCKWECYTGKWYFISEDEAQCTTKQRQFLKETLLLKLYFHLLQKWKKFVFITNEIDIFRLFVHLTIHSKH